MKRYYIYIVTITFFCLFISATAAAELYTAKPEEVGLSSERLNQLGASLKAHIEKGVIPGGVGALPVC